MSFPVYFSLGPLRLHPHLVMEALAYAVGLYISLFGRLSDQPSSGISSSQRSSVAVGALVGALLGGLIGVEVTQKLIGVSRSTGDSFVCSVLSGTAIGRVGCFLTGLSDRTYGIATSLPWGVDFGDGIPRHPTQLYEIGFLMILFGVLRLCDQRPRQEGDLFKIFMIAYLGFRLCIDFIKPEFQGVWAASFW